MASTLRVQRMCYRMYFCRVESKEREKQDEKRLVSQFIIDNSPIQTFRDASLH